MRALRNIHSALIPNGLLVDTQPVGPQPLVAIGGEEAGRIDMFEWMSTVAAVDLMLDETVDCGLFEMCDEVAIAVVDSFDNGAECLSTVAAWRGTHVPAALVRLLEAAQAVVTVEQDVRLRLLRRR